METDYTFSEGFSSVETLGEPDNFVAIDFIELSLNQDSLHCEGDCETSGDFERVVIGDIDGFGWADGAVLLEEGIASGVMNPRTAPEAYPANRDGLGLLVPVDFLPDTDGSQGVHFNETGQLNGLSDDWDNRSLAERGKAHLPEALSGRT